MTADEVRAAIRKRYDDHRRYAVAEEVGLTTGYSHRRLDMMVLDCYNSNGFRIDGFEIKVSTGDLRRELQDPEKHIAFFNVIDYYTLAVPGGVADPLMDIIPKKWGILIINEDGSTRYKRKPIALEDKKADGAVPRGFLASIVRSIQGRQPATQELQAKYDEGYEAGKNDEARRQEYGRNRVKERIADLDAYDQLRSKLRIWGGTEDVEEAIAEFEAFRQLDVRWLRSSLDGTAARLQELSKKLSGQLNEKETAE